MITVISRGRYYLLDDPPLLILGMESEPGVIKSIYRFKPYQKKEKIKFISTSRVGIDRKIALDRFRMYEVMNETKFEDGVHLELCTGHGKWSCYVLPRGMPDEKHRLKNYAHTTVCITKCCCGGK